MSKRKHDPSTTGLSSPNVEGQGTTESESAGRQKASSRKKTKKH
ncbi:YuzL family protein [Mesobacillus zeae]|uniref:YuzL family protein n=1 Tax=Mesobacillus zeae TaxID=1917180 RepID=A0A398B9R8_9BACI|nr:YuzL family protein [Mesobacillus zeae]RID85598.1 YuzL family protein [Mesobacillus zeae]